MRRFQLYVPVTAIIGGIQARTAVAQATSSAGAEAPWLGVLLIAAAAGGFGGLVHGMTVRSDSETRYTIALPFSGRKKDIGFIGSVFIGIAAATASLFALETLFGLKLADAGSVDTLLKLIALGVICGYAGSGMLDSLSLLRSKRLVKGEKEFFEGQEALQGAPTADVTHLYDAAIALTTQAIELDRQSEYKGASARAHYDRACYKQLRGSAKAEVLADLEQAIALSDDMRKLAKFDPDFDGLRQDVDFNTLVDVELRHRDIARARAGQAA